MFPALRAHGISAGRTAEILSTLGLLRDDRVPAFETWLERHLAGLAPGIRADVEHWLRTLRHGGPRSRPRDPETTWNYLHAAAPVLAAWSGRYDHLREVTSEDILSPSVASPATSAITPSASSGPCSGTARRTARSSVTPRQGCGSASSPAASSCR